MAGLGVCATQRPLTTKGRIAPAAAVARQWVPYEFQPRAGERFEIPRRTSASTFRNDVASETTIGGSRLSVGTQLFFGASCTVGVVVMLHLALSGFGRRGH